MDWNKLAELINKMTPEERATHVAIVIDGEVYQPRRKTPAFRRGDIRREVPVDTGAQMFYAEIS